MKQIERRGATGNRELCCESFKHSSHRGQLPFDVLSLDFIRDPYPAYHRLRREDPMHWCPLGFYLASRHTDIAFILRDYRFGKDFGGRLRRSSGDKALEEPVYQSMLRWMVNQTLRVTHACAGFSRRPSPTAAWRTCGREFRRSSIKPSIK